MILPPIGSRGYHVLLGAVAILILGPLGGIAASYMNFSLGFFVGGQVLAGILGSVVTFGYGAEGKHGANYMQTMAASVAGMAAMGVLIQAMVWLGLTAPPTWQLIAYFLSIGMLGVGLGMLYTPLLVDRMQLAYPSGLAVANILRALTDVRLLRRSVAQLLGGMGLGSGATLLAEKGIVGFLGAIQFSASTFGAGLIVGARIGVPAIVVGLIGLQLTPWLRAEGLLGPNDPWRKVGFLIALGTIIGAAIVDITLILREAWKRSQAARQQPVVEAEDWKKVNTSYLALWVAVWAVAVIGVSSGLLGIPVGFACMGVALAFVLVLVNGISLGISDSNPISSAFVVGVTIMAAAGLTDPLVGLIAGSILLITTSAGGDMQQDRSTGWRLGTNRVNQFRYQVIGIVMGAVLAVFVTKLFLAAYPVLSVDTFLHPEQKAANWQSAMTYKFVGVLRGLTSADTTALKLMALGIAIGLAVELVRELLKASAAYQGWKGRSAATRTADFVIDAILVPSPYASSFGGFVEWLTALWFGLGGIFSSVWKWALDRLNAGKPKPDGLPEDMSTMSLLGGGLIAGEALAFLALGIIGLMSLVR
ncbi:MAG: peptide transporter [Betaproteobacteria bacterium RIFCSPLOWO2_12_FULL_67_28]|nr:MAG: peptide transporter [Betaproteobacteria bacterium RIFCSPLOWO2_12_FULL_67_28]